MWASVAAATAIGLVVAVNTFDSAVPTSILLVYILGGSVIALLALSAVGFSNER